MKVLLLLIIATSALGQSLTPTFSALIVKDIDVSIAWYQEKLGYELRNKTENTERGFKLANLEHDVAELELIELSAAIDLSKSLDGYTNRTRWVGIFKVGFTVEDFDLWIRHLESVNADFYGDVVTMNERRMVIIKDPDGNRIQLFEQ